MTGSQQAPPAQRAGFPQALPARRAGLQEALPTGWANFREALHAEWTKLRTLPSTGLLLAAIVVLTVAVAPAVAAGASCQAAGCQQDPARISLTGVQLGQAIVAILAVLAMSGEYAEGMIRVTLAAMPRRSTVLAAKATVLSGLLLAAGTVAVLGCLLVGGLILPGKGFTAAHGFAPLSLGQGPTLRAAAGSVLYLVLIGLLGLGIAAAVRDAATAVGTALGLLYVFPLAELAVGGNLSRHLAQIGPATAGLAIQATRGIATLPIGPWPGLGVLAAYAAAAIAAGWALLRWRDA